MKKWLLLITIAILGVVFFALDLNQLLTLDGVQRHLVLFEQWRSDAPLLVVALFFTVYVLVAALSLPGAAVMTLAAGALFGLWWGTLIVSFASTIGATCAFLAARYLLKETVQRRFGERLQALNHGVEKDGAFYLFTLRLVPLFPFFLINILMGLTTLRAVTFYWVSQVGMLAGTLIYVNAGTQLAQLDSIKGILSPAILFSFALLGIFPLVAKKVVEKINQRRRVSE